MTILGRAYGRVLSSVAVWAWLLSATVFAEESLVAPIFNNHMVLQRDMQVPVWGMAAPGESVTVQFAGQTESAKAGPDGRWSIKLAKLRMSKEPLIMTISSGTRQVKIEDVLVGEVWLCSGQSNMEWSMGRSDSAEDIPKADIPLIRHTKPRGKQPWTVCSSNSVSGFTAVGFYFARKIHAETGVPVGLIHNAIGGTAIEPWIPSWTGVHCSPKLAEMERDREAKPEGKEPYGGLYKPHTEPLIPYGIRGVIWYQGESNGGEGETYTWKMEALVGGLRKVWGQPPAQGSGGPGGDFPFYFVQLTAFRGDNNNPEGGDGWAKIRQAQVKAMEIPKTGMAVSIDVGAESDIHPRNKFDVGTRLALWALAKDYGKDIECSGPLYKSMKADGNKIRVSFDHVGKGLMVGRKDGRKPVEEDKEGKLKRFAICGSDKKWFWADAVIDGSTVVVSSADVAQPVAVRYAYSGNPKGCNLYNRDGLPASPFLTE